MLVFFGLFWPGFHEGAGAAASAGPAAPGGAAEDHAAAALVPQPALQEAVPEPAARGHQHTGGCCCWIPVQITILKSYRHSPWVKSDLLCKEGACNQD